MVELSQTPIDKAQLSLLVIDHDVLQRRSRNSLVHEVLGPQLLPTLPSPPLSIPLLPEESSAGGAPVASMRAMVMGAE